MVDTREASEPAPTLQRNSGAAGGPAWKGAKHRGRRPEEMGSQCWSHFLPELSEPSGPASSQLFL